MLHVGIDLHQKTCRVVGFDDANGEVFLDEDVPSERKAMLSLLEPFRNRGQMRLILEACGFAGYWMDVLDPLGEVVAVHPKGVRDKRGHRRKNDRRDAAFLAELSHLERLPRSYLGTTAERDLKDLLRYRVGLVQLQTRLRLRLRSVLRRYGVVLDVVRVDGPTARDFWREMPLRQTHRLTVDQMLEVLAELDERVARVEEEIARRAAEKPVSRTVELLDTLPGLGLIGAMLVAAEIGNWRRFPSGDALACYAGLVPSEDSSGPQRRLGPITKEGPTYLRWMMIEAALRCGKSPRLKRLYERVVHRGGPMKARVAVAREMLFIAWNMLKNDCPYEERGPSRPRSAEAPQKRSAGSTSSGKLEVPLTR